MDWQLRVIDSALSQRADCLPRVASRDIYKALLALISGGIKSNPRLRLFRKATNEPLKLPGIGQLKVPGVVWEFLKDDQELAAEWDVTIEDGEGTSPEFTMTKR